MTEDQKELRRLRYFLKCHLNGCRIRIDSEYLKTLIKEKGTIKSFSDDLYLTYSKTYSLVKSGYFPLRWIYKIKTVFNLSDDQLDKLCFLDKLP